MTHADIKRIFPNASASLLAANSGPDATVERHPCHEPLATREIQEDSTASILVRITSRRHRLADPDGLCEKYFLDCCRYCGWIVDDSAEVIQLVTRQKKIPKDQPEETIIEIFQLT